ncbi:MAG TPA: hypothetical protein VNJ52_07655 [Patescibacteria group bacterium]|nr:hypothetical protein [Patescibacteria group bacterium]
MVHNEGLRSVVRQLCGEIVDGFRAEGANFESPDFLSTFPYAFFSTWDSPQRELILAAALSPAYREEMERSVEAFYSNSSGGTTEFYMCEAIQDFLNYLIPRAAGLPDEELIFDELYSQFDESLFGGSCLVTTFAVLKNVWDHSGSAVLPDGFSLRYVDQGLPHPADGRWLRDRMVPYFEIRKSVRPVAGGRDIREKFAYFLLEHTVALPKNKALLRLACVLRDETARKFSLAVRLLNPSAAFSDYRGFRTVGRLGTYLKMMNFPDECIDQGESCELSGPAAVQVGTLMAKLEKLPWDRIALIDMKIEDALRRTMRPTLDGGQADKRVAIDQLLDYFQALEQIVPVNGSEYIALYSATLLKASGNHKYKADPYGTYAFIKKMHKVRNDVMHGRLDKVIASDDSHFSPEDVRRFGQMVRVLAGLFILNGELREAATKLALGEGVVLESVYGVSPQAPSRHKVQGASHPGW